MGQCLAKLVPAGFLRTKVVPNEVEEDMTDFAPVMAILKLDRLPDLALSIRADHMVREKSSTQDASKALRSCTVIHPPLFGSYHIVYVLAFFDNVRWALKVPATGHLDSWDESTARALASEANTMRLIARETATPIPTVYHFDNSLDNEIRCPFILMDFVDGISAQDIWFNASVDEERLEQHRERTLRDVAKAMLELSKFSYDLGGAPVYDERGSPIGIGPMRTSHAEATSHETQSDNPDEPPSPCEQGPFTDPKAFMLSSLDQRQPPPDAFSVGIHKLLRLFIEWLPPDTRQPQFVLAHPDLDIQNVLVDRDGGLVALIDWDGVAAQPRCLGNERLPSWLTRDWDPANYAYGTATTDGNDTYWENSPTELARYRSMYSGFVRDYMRNKNEKEATGLSLLVDNLAIAAEDPICTDGIVERVFDECLAARKPIFTLDLPKVKDDTIEDESEDEDAELYLYELVTELKDGDFDQEQLAILKDGFLALCSKLKGL